MGKLGASVATETCGQRMPLKLRITFWEYWIWVEVTVIWRGWVIAVGGCTENTEGGPPVVWAGMVSGGWPGVQTGTVMVCCTVSIQKKELISTVCAFGRVAVWLPRRKAMLSLPPPNSGLLGVVVTPRAVVERIFWWAVALRRTVFGSSRMAWVMDPFLMNLARFCGIRAVCLSLAVWLGNAPDIGGDANRGDRGRAG